MADRRFSEVTRRDFLRWQAAAFGLLAADGDPARIASTLAQPAHDDDSTAGESFVDVDYAALVGRTDLWYLSPVEESLEGHPIGNGRMGTLVWTTPSSLEFQINRVDVFAINRNHMGIWQFIDGRPIPPESSDYMGACAKVSLDVGGQPFAKGPHFRQHLSVYNAESTVEGAGVQARCFISAASDIMVVEVHDQRPVAARSPIRLTLALWRKPVEQVGPHRSEFAFLEDDGTQTHAVTRTFTEEDYYCRSAVAVGAGSGQLRLDTTTEMQHVYQVTPGPDGRAIVVVSSAASMDRSVDVVARATAALNAARGKTYAALRQPHRAWWASFWRRTFVHLTSTDGVADFMERLRTMHLYIMASSSRGALPPKWNGMIFTTAGDYRNWGCQYWNWTMETLYFPLLAADASDLSYPYFNMYVSSLPQYRRSAEQMWNAKGAWIHEVVSFDGTRSLPEDVAAHYAAVTQGTMNSSELTDRDRSFGKYDHILLLFALNEVGPCGNTGHSQQYSGGATIAINAWFRYRYTGDKAWLRTHAYPLLHDLTEFYRSIAVKKPDGLYHMVRTNVHESWGGVDDGITDMAALHGMVPLAIRASEILGVDADLRTQWREFLAHLAPLPMGRDPKAKALAGAVLADDAWAMAHLGACDAAGQDREESTWVDPIFPYENYTLSSKDAELTRTAQRTMDLVPHRTPIMQGKLGGLETVDGRVSGLTTAIRLPIVLARLGRGEDLPAMLCGYFGSFDGKQQPNGFSMFEGHQAHSAEILGVIAMTLQEGLMQSVSPSPGEPEIIWVAPAWPKRWNAAFSLLARGGFLVTATVTNGVVAFVEIKSRRGERCRLRNPWSTPCYLTEGEAGVKQRQTGSLIEFPTKAGQTYRLFVDKPPARVRIAPKSEAAPAVLSCTLSGDVTVTGILGRKA